MSISDILAKFWDDRLEQIVVIEGRAWKHLPGGNWYLVRNIDE